MGVKDFHLLLKELKISYKDDSLYEAAFTHASYRNEHPDTCKADYQRLEFIGDGVLDLVIADFLFRRFPQMDEGGLSRCRASLVRGETETEFAKSMHFEEYIRRSRGEELSGSISSKILEDVFESFIGAYYLDNLPDYEKIKKFIYGFFRSPIEDYKEMETFDYKSKIQEIIQSDGKTAVQFPIVEETGEGQNKMFTAQVTSNGVVLGTGRGTSSKKAQQEAAKDALEKMVK